ncbi:MAG: hypothetical protein RLZZ488_2794 [Pseudomonadota bacterium]|jgi:tetratricopeptide (TPR) repeat protein
MQEARTSSNPKPVHLMRSFAVAAGAVGALFFAPVPPASASDAVMRPMPVRLVPANSQQKQQTLKKIEELLDQENIFEARDLLRVFSEKEIEKNPRLLVCKALILKGLYKTDESFELLRQALKLDEDFAPAQYETALILMERKQWIDADVLLRLAAAADDLSGQRRLLLPYYLGVIAFETGRLFDSRSSFVRLTWNDSLDPALQQSAAAFMSRIARQRPWTLVSPLSYQYETNVLGLPRNSELPSTYKRRAGSKILAGMFANVEGLGGHKKGDGPFGLGLRVFGIRNMDRSFAALDVLFAEAETNWSKYAGRNLGIFKLSTTANYVRAGSKSLTSSAGLKMSLAANELNLAYEADLQKSSSADRSSALVRFFRDQALGEWGSLTLSIPFDAGYRLPLKKNPAERKGDVSLTPSVSFALSKRSSLKLTNKVLGERTSSQLLTAPQYALKNTAGLGLTFSLQPYLTVSSNGSYDWERNFKTQSVVQKGVVTISLLGIL